VSVSVWSWRTKRHQFHFFAQTPIVAPAKSKKAHVHYYYLFSASLTTNLVCPSILYDELVV
jgi:hypothetical protein